MCAMKAMKAEVPEVITWGIDHTGGKAQRASMFRAGDLEVTVRPHGDADTEVAFAKACELARSVATIESLRTQITDLQIRVRELAAKVPPAKGARLLGTGYVRFDAKGRPWLLNNLARGWGEFGMCHDSWDELFRRFDVRVTGHGTDETGPWWSVENGGAQ